MRARRRGSIITWISVLFLITAIIILAYMLISFSRSRATYPSNMQIAEVPVGGLTREQAAQRLLEAYNLPVELHYEEEIIQLDPAVIDFQLNLESMLATADYTRIGGQFWNEFWDYLWANPSEAADIPLDASFSEQLLRNYLTNEISARYDQPAIPAQPRAGSVNFIPGVPGSTVNIDRAVAQIENALFSPTRRVVELILQTSNPARPSLANLQILLEQLLDTANFEGIASVYIVDLQTLQEIHFIYRDSREFPTEPDLAFSGASLIKVPVMISTYIRLDSEPDAETSRLLREMIDESQNTSTDAVIQQYIDSARGPLLVTDDIRSLGLENTFLGGYFYYGAPLLATYTTPAQSRTDLDTDPDKYNQTTATDIGTLLTDLYQCAEYGGGALLAVFPEKISRQECQDMLEVMSLNNQPFLIRGGVPSDTRIAQKFGYVPDASGAVLDIGQAAIVYTPSGDYVQVIFFHHPVQLVWDPNNILYGQLSEAVYNYFTITE
jgi:beta-lactamase class A